MRSLLLACQFLTVLPIRIHGEVRSRELSASMRYYPLVGALIGAASATVYMVTQAAISEPAACFCALVAVVLLSGGLHLEGFADFCDGFYGGKTREQMLLIMKDSRSGPMAVIGLICLLGAKWVFLTSVPSALRVPVLIAMPVFGRWSLVFLSRIATYARTEGGAGSPYIGKVSAKDVTIAAVIGGIVVYYVLQWPGLALMVLVTAFAWLFKRWVTHRISGMTGDTLGACAELVETIVLIMLSLRITEIGLGR